MRAAHNRSIVPQCRSLLLIATLSLVAGGCLEPPHRQIEQRLYRTVTFDSATDLTILPSDYWDGRGRLELTNVVEIGGQIVYVRGQTLVMDPVYVLTSDVGGTHSLRTKGSYQLPDRVVVLTDSGTQVRSFSLPRGRAGSRSFISVVLPALLVLSFIHRSGAH